MGVPQTTGHHPILLGPVDPTNQQPFFDDEEIELDVPENFNVCKSLYTHIHMLWRNVQVKIIII